MAALPVCAFHWVPFVLKSGEQTEGKYMAQSEFVFSSFVLTEILKGIQSKFVFFFPFCVIGMGVPNTTSTVYGFSFIFQRQ